MRKNINTFSQRWFGNQSRQNVVEMFCANGDAFTALFELRLILRAWCLHVFTRALPTATGIAGASDTRLGRQMTDSKYLSSVPVSPSPSLGEARPGELA